MRLTYLQHVPFEGPANIESWASERGFSCTPVRLYLEEPLPSPETFDWLVVMGGPMNIYEEEKYPWLADEKRAIAGAIDAGKAVLGICLGAQLVSDVLGGAVYRNPVKEIGWHPVRLTPEARESVVFSGLPAEFTAFHWHGDTFHLPSGTLGTATSEGCAIQAFEAKGGRVVGLQFHLESSPESIRLLIENCGDELVPGKYIQTADEILSRKDSLTRTNGPLRHILDRMTDTLR
jgi:GMP synthase-like glutamine amidotransferase